MKHKVQLLIIASLVAILAVFTSCQDASAEHFEGNAKSITVVVAEKSSKVITAAGSSGDISHYKVTVENKAENYTRESDYLSKGSVYNVTNVPAGIWTATVEAYVHFESNEVPFLVSSGTETAYFPEGISNITKEGTGYKITSGSDSYSLISASGQILAGGNAVSYTIVANTITLTSDSLDNLVISLNVEADIGYVKVAEATSEEVRVGTDESVTIPVTLDTLIDALSGDINVTLDMPKGLDSDGTTFYYTYTIAGTGQRSEYSYTMDTPTQGTVDGSGNGTFTIDADAINPQLNQGAYLLTVTVFDQATEEASEVVRKGVEIMRLLPGTPSEGSINLDTDIGYPSGSLLDAEISIVDKIGDKLDLGEASYDNTNDVLIITVDYNTVSTSTPVDVYIDGVKSNPSATTSGTSRTFRFSTFPDGYHLVTFVLDEADTQLGVESLTVQVNTPIEGSIELVNHFLYSDNGDGTCVITGEDPQNPLLSHNNLEIPSEIKGLKVTKIGYEAFCNAGFTGTLKLPEGLQTIGSSAFSRNSFTGTLTIPSSVTSLGSSTFYGNSFTGTLTLPEGLKTIGNYAFYENSFTGTLTLPEGLQTIGDQAFSGNSFTGDLVIPSSITYIGEQAFSGNSFTGDLVIPSSITYIGEQAFYNNAFTGTLTLSEGLQTIGESAFEGNSFTGELIIPDSVTEIGSSAFANNRFTGDLVIPSSITYIGSFAFYGNSFIQIYCESISQPSGWSSNWDYDNSPVIWGYTGSGPGFNDGITQT